MTRVGESLSEFAHRVDSSAVLLGGDKLRDRGQGAEVGLGDLVVGGGDLELGVEKLHQLHDAHRIDYALFHQLVAVAQHEPGSHVEEAVGDELPGPLKNLLLGHALIYPARGWMPIAVGSRMTTSAPASSRNLVDGFCRMNDSSHT